MVPFISLIRLPALEEMPIDKSLTSLRLWKEGTITPVSCDEHRTGLLHKGEGEFNDTQRGLRGVFLSLRMFYLFRYNL